MRFTFLVHLALMVLLNLLIKPLAIFGIDAQVQNEVGATEYGFYFSLLNFTYLFNIVLDFGITNFNTKYMAQYPHLARQYIGKILPLRVALLLIYIALTLILAVCLGYSEKQFNVLYILILNQFIISVILYFRSYFSGLLYLKIDILLSVMDKFFLIILMGYFLYAQTGFPVTVSLFVWLQTCSLGLTLLIALILLLSKIGFPVIKWNLSFNRFLLRKSFPYALLIVLMMLYNRVDSIMLERMLPDGEYQAGIYAQAYRLLDAFFMFATLFSSLLFPILARMLKEGKDIKPLLGTAGNILLPGAIVLAVICFADWQFILDLIYHRDIREAGAVFRILMFSFIPICITLLFGTLLTVNGNLRFLNWVSFAGIWANVGLNLILIPKYGALGTTYATLLTQGIVALVQLFYAVRLFRMEINAVLLSKYALLIAALVTIPFALDAAGLSWNRSLVMLLTAFAILLGTRLLDWKAFLELLKTKKS
ncbi:MAG: oligosaccharide flippase family protein [Bacteroidota bacterium]